MRKIAEGVEVCQHFRLSSPKGIGFISHAYGMSDDSRHRAKILNDRGYNSVIFKRDDKIITEKPNAISQAIDAIQMEMCDVLESSESGDNIISAASLGGVMIGAAAARMEGWLGIPPVELIVHDSPLLNGTDRCHDYFVDLKDEWDFHNSNVYYLNEIRDDYENIVAVTPTRFLLEKDDPHNQFPILKKLQEKYPASVEISRIDLPGKRHGFLLPKVREAVSDAIGIR